MSSVAVVVVVVVMVAVVPHPWISQEKEVVMYVTRGGSRKTEWQNSGFWKKSGSPVIGMSPLRMISRCVCEGRWVCACVVSSGVHRTARNAESLLLLIVRCWTVSASQPDTTHRAPTQQLETPREGRRLTTAKRVCSLADPASSQPVQPAVRDPAAQSGYMTLLQRTGAPVREIRVGGWRPRGLLCCSRERVLPKTGSRLQHTKPHQTTPHTSHTTLSLRGCMHLQARRSLAMQAAVLSREEAMGGWPRH